MLTIGSCPRCHKYKLSPESCRCCLFRYWQEGEEPEPLYATDAEDAAEAAGRVYFDQEPGDDEMEIFIEDVSTGEVTRWTVRPVTSIDFDLTQED